MAALENVIVRPLITEKVSLATERGSIYGFRVILRANKHQVREAVEKLYSVKVLRVNTLVNPGKLRRRRTGIVKAPKWKKALVQLAEGQSIELFKGI